MPAVASAARRARLCLPLLIDLDLDPTAVLYTTYQTCQIVVFMAMCTAVRMYCLAARTVARERDEKGGS